MKKILAFSGSNSSKSINQNLIKYTSNLIVEGEVTVIDIKDFELPFYSLDMDPDETPENLVKLIELIEGHDGFIVASPEHNGGTPAVFKNITDWLSRRSKKVFNDKPMLLMSASPGAGGGATHRTFLEKTLPYQGANIVSTYSLGSYYEKMNEGKLIEAEQSLLVAAVQKFEQALK